MTVNDTNESAYKNNVIAKSELSKTGRIKTLITMTVAADGDKNNTPRRALSPGNTTVI